MAVVIQEMINGEISGVAFSVAPDRHDQSAVEAVYGLNQGLVDGTVEPDRWHVSRETGAIIAHFPPASRKSYMSPSDSGAALIDLPSKKASTPPLKDKQIKEVAQSAMKQEEKWKHPRDTEWTFINEDFFVLQSRPITEVLAKKNDDRQWYKNLLQSFEKLKETREIIEKKLLPEMLEDANLLEKEKLEKLTNQELLANIQKRRKICIKHHQAYYKFCIPFAHGTRLFGEIYNEKIQPEDPYEFVEILRSNEMKSLKRNETFSAIAKEINSKKLKTHIENKVFDELPEDLLEKISELASDVFEKKINHPSEAPDAFWKTLAKFDATLIPRNIKENLKKEFLKKFRSEEKNFARELIDIGRASYRLRDDDNLYLIKVEKELKRALKEAQKRQDAQASLKDFEKELTKGVPELQSSPKITNENLPANYKIDYRQLVGQPAGKGLAKAKAKVINNFQDLFDFQKGEIMICDAVEPEMTFVAPLAAAIVERRGGMLIHGAIIAREYGLPCVTGVPAATERIKTGDTITVDGWLGIVTIDRNSI
jgi:pyruvate,water dikinase